jgi:hypothetical protein
MPNKPGKPEKTFSFAFVVNGRVSPLMTDATVLSQMYRYFRDDLGCTGLTVLTFIHRYDMFDGIETEIYGVDAFGTDSPDNTYTNLLTGSSI